MAGNGLLARFECQTYVKAVLARQGPLRPCMARIWPICVASAGTTAPAASIPPDPLPTRHRVRSMAALMRATTHLERLAREAGSRRSPYRRDDLAQARAWVAAPAVEDEFVKISRLRCGAPVQSSTAAMSTAASR